LSLLPLSSADARTQRTDPDASSPAGVIYEIPFDNARKDAAPKQTSEKGKDGGDQQSAAGAAGSTGSGGGSTGSGTGTGAAAGDASDRGGSGNSSDGDTSGSGAPPDAQSNPNVGTSIHSENGFGSSSVVPGTSTQGSGDEPPSSALRTAGTTSSTSSAATFGLLILVALVAGWIGIAASRNLRS
jgi:hypothetical protein